MSKLWLTPIGVTQSIDKGRAPPLSDETWKSACAQLFSEGSNIVLHTDGALAYKKMYPGVKERPSSQGGEQSRRGRGNADTLEANSEGCWGRAKRVELQNS